MAANSLKATGPLQISWLRPWDDCTNPQCTMSTTLVITVTQVLALCRLKIHFNAHYHVCYENVDIRSNCTFRV